MAVKFVPAFELSLDIAAVLLSTMQSIYLLRGECFDLIFYVARDFIKNETIFSWLLQSDCRIERKYWKN